MPARENQIVVYQPNETVRLDVRLENETVWLTQEQMSLLFGRDQSVIARHIGNIFKEGELDRISVHAKNAYIILAYFHILSSVIIMLTLLIRTVLIYLIVTAAVRVMGKRQVSDMQTSELVVTLIISQVASLPLENPERPQVNP